MSKTTRNILGTVLAVTLAAGVAWAMETQRAATPLGNSFTATAVIFPGSAGADVYGGGGKMFDEFVRFSIGFGTDGMLTVNGALIQSFDTSAQYTVVADCELVNGDWLADFTVVNDSTGLTEYVETGYVMDDKPEGVVATASSVYSLVVE